MLEITGAEPVMTIAKPASQLLMNYKSCLAIAGTDLAFVVNAVAQPDVAAKPPPLIESVLISVAPLVIVAALMWWFFTGPIRRMNKRSQDHLERQQRHYQNLESLLERIAKSLEKKDKDVV